MWFSKSIESESVDWPTEKLNIGHSVLKAHPIDGSIAKSPNKVIGILDDLAIVVLNDGTWENTWNLRKVSKT